MEPAWNDCDDEGDEGTLEMIVMIFMTDNISDDYDDEDEGIVPMQKNSLETSQSDLTCWHTHLVAAEGQDEDREGHRSSHHGVCGRQSVL